MSAVTALLVSMSASVPNKNAEEDVSQQVYTVPLQQEAIHLDTGDNVGTQTIRSVVREQIAKMDKRVIEEIPGRVASINLERNEAEVVFLRDNKVQGYVFPLDNLQQVGLVDPIPDDEVVFQICQVGHGIPFGEFLYVPQTEMESVSELKAKFPPGYFDSPNR